MNRRSLAIIGAWLLAAVCGASDFMAGFTHAQVVAEFGNPHRMISTGTGVLMFYGSLFLEMENEAVVFINASSLDWVERKRMEDASRGIFWGRAKQNAEFSPPLASDLATRRTMTPTEQREWLEERQIAHERVMETRVRRFLLTRTFRDILELYPVASMATSHATSGTDFDQGQRHGAMDLKSSVSFLNLKDSRGRRIPNAGERGGFVERHVDFAEALYPATVAQSRPY